MKSFQKLSMEPSSGTRCACFTLIELLVVIAIIAITTSNSIKVKTFLFVEHILNLPFFFEFFI